MISLLLCSHTSSTPRVISVDRVTRKATKSTPKKEEKIQQRKKKWKKSGTSLLEVTLGIKCLCDHRCGAVPGSGRGAKGLSEGNSTRVRAASTACSNIKTFSLVVSKKPSLIILRHYTKNPWEYASRPQPRHLLREPTAALSEKAPMFTIITVNGLFFATC